MHSALVAVAAIALFATSSVNAEAPPVVPVDSATSTAEVMRKPGNIYLGQTITFEDAHRGNVSVKVGPWEAGVPARR